MKTIGLIGGMSWESTALYYRILNQRVKERCGELHSARLVLYSVEFSEIKRLQHENRWDEAGAVLADAARSVRAAGADFLVLCTNTMHKVAPAIEAAVDVPLIHIADPTAEAILTKGIRRIGLLGTRFTMEEDFYRERLRNRYGIEALIPEKQDRAVVHRVIFEELIRGKVLDASRLDYIRIMQRLVDAGAEGIILGCTEITMLVGAGDASVPLFDTTTIHAQHAADIAVDETLL
jgi:aspartate racemase